MSREDKMRAIIRVLAQYTMPIDQFGFVTEEYVADEMLKAIGE